MPNVENKRIQNERHGKSNNDAIVKEMNKTVRNVSKENAQNAENGDICETGMDTSYSNSSNKNFVEEPTQLTILTIIKNEIVNVLTNIKKFEYNKNVDSSITDALFILYNSINNLGDDKKNIRTVKKNFNEGFKLDIYHIAPFLNIIRNNTIFYKIKLIALQSLDHILKYHDQDENGKEESTAEPLKMKQISYMSVYTGEEQGSSSAGKIESTFNSEETYLLNKKGKNIMNYNNMPSFTNEKYYDTGSTVKSGSKISEKLSKKKSYLFFNRNAKLHKKNLKNEEKNNIIINKGNDIINVTVETLLNAPYNCTNISHEEIYLYHCIMIFKSILYNNVKTVDKKNIIKIICHIIKIYKNNKYSMLLKNNCESVLMHIFYIVIDYLTKNENFDFLNDLLMIILILLNNQSTLGNSNTTPVGNPNNPVNTNVSSGDNFILDCINKREYKNIYLGLLENEMSLENVETVNMLAYRLLNMTLEVCGYRMTKYNLREMVNIIRCLFVHLNSPSYMLISKSMRAYINIFILYKQHYFIYNEVFINLLLNLLKQNVSKNITETTLLSISHFCNEQILFETFYTYDANIHASDLLENFFKTVLSICMNFYQNTSIVNEVIFRMVKNIVIILTPSMCRKKSGKNCIFIHTNKGNKIREPKYVESLSNVMNEDFISEIKNDMKKETCPPFSFNENSSYMQKDDPLIYRRRNKHTGNVMNRNTSEEESPPKKKNIKERKHQREKSNTKKKNKTHGNKGTDAGGEIMNNRKELMDHLEKLSDISKNSADKEYTLRFSSAINDKKHAQLYPLFLFEDLKEHIKIQYIKHKKNIMRKKKLKKRSLENRSPSF